MPQMAPINWVTLYILFILVFLVFIIINYFSFIYPPKIMKKTKEQKITSWKW